MLLPHLMFFPFALKRILYAIVAFFSFISLSRNQYSVRLFPHDFALFLSPSRMSFSIPFVEFLRYVTVIQFQFTVSAFLCIVFPGREGGGGSNIKNRRGLSSENLNLTLKETIWARLKLFVTPKGDRSGRGLRRLERGFRCTRARNLHQDAHVS